MKLLFTLFALLLFSCSSNKEEHENVKNVSQELAIHRPHMFGANAPATTWHGKIKVCWDDTWNFEHPDHIQEMATIKTAIDLSWLERGYVQFVGWLDCHSQPGLVTLSRTTFGGYTAYTVHNPYLKVVFSITSHSITVSHLESVSYLARHEFGHVLGFIHEHDRDDIDNQTCNAPTAELKPVENVTPNNEKIGDDIVCSDLSQRFVNRLT